MTTHWSEEQRVLVTTLQSIHQRHGHVLHGPHSHDHWHLPPEVTDRRRSCRNDRRTSRLHACSGNRADVDKSLAVTWTARQRRQSAGKHYIASTAPHRYGTTAKSAPAGCQHCSTTHSDSTTGSYLRTFAYNNYCTRRRRYDLNHGRSP